ncbi:hypothetical protein [Nocardia sp. NPDC051463]|uniref:hypothetical protein n=1 Tax=Nocardia sp. NPDC051463 TaxID=3154845 RepID=UPI00344C73F8
MSEDLRPRLIRVLAQMHEAHAARLRLQAQMIETAATFRAFANAYQSGFDDALADHPDLAEVNVMLDGFYAEAGGSGT